LTWRDSPQFRSTALALAVVLACALTWSVLPTILLSAPHGDNVEQLNWSQAFQWGYFKHPPLPTWLLRAAIGVFGPSAALTYALAMACVAVALMLVWLCARQVLAPREALVALLLSSANYYLMGRGSFLNHNTVMLPFVALSAWAVLRIVRGAGWPMWLMLGLAQALGLLTKYQMALIILANGVALLAAGAHRQPRFGAHVALASVATLVPLIPHAAWLADHQFTTFEYAGHSLLAGLDAVHRLSACASFLAQQLARLAPALVALVLLIIVSRRPPPSSVEPGVKSGPLTPSPSPQGARGKVQQEMAHGHFPNNHSGADGAQQADTTLAMRALTVLALVPLAGIVVLVLIAGVAPQNHWGSSTTLLIPLLWVTRLQSKARQSIIAACAATALCHAVAIVWNVVVWKVDPGPHHRFAARPLAALAQQHWSSHENGPIRLVIGPDWEAGSIALYLPGHPTVLPNADWRQAPWIDRGLLSRCGALVIARADIPLQQQFSLPEAVRATELTTLKAADSLGRESTIQAALIGPSPSSACR
jgi:Dolichyl-phosphate-mannose-protein mannosyltransferase